MDENHIHSTKTSQSDFFGNEPLDFASVIHLQKQSLLQKKRNLSHLTSSISRRVDHRNMMMARPSNFAINQPVFDIFICIFHHQHPSTISHLFSCIFFGHFYHSLTISGESCSERDKISIQNGKVFHIFPTIHHAICQFVWGYVCGTFISRQHKQPSDKLALNITPFPT